MDTCSTEVIAHIVEYACCDDFGQTARCIGLVSKYFRIISEPIELRTIAVSGLEQLQGALARIKSYMRSYALEGMAVDIRHLFICELRRKHAIAADIDFRNEIADYLPRDSFWRTRKGIVAEAWYREYSGEFWNLAAGLVRSASRNIRTLFLLASDNWFPSRGSFSNRSILPKVLGALSGSSFPKLVSLTVNHNAADEVASFGEDGSLFQCPTSPSLRRLHIRSPVFMDPYHPNQGLPPRVHPLISRVHSLDSEVTHLVICDDRMWTASGALRAIFGETWETILGGGKLPGKLRSVILQQGIAPHFGPGTGYTNYRRWTKNFVDNLMALHVDGLEAHPPAPAFPEPGKREYELLLDEWKEQCLVIYDEDEIS